MKPFQGTSISCGYATGKAGLYRKDLPVIPCYSISKEQVEGEWLRFIKALELTKHQLTDCKKVVAFSMGVDKADVFEVQIALLDDSYIQQQLRSVLISELKNVEFCLEFVVKNCIQKFSQHNVLQVREKYLDLKDVAVRVMKNLLSNSANAHVGSYLEGSIIFTKALEPSDVIFLQKYDIKGIVLEENCSTSHAIILAKGLNVPIVIGLDKICTFVKNGMQVSLNGSSGLVILEPDSKCVKFNEDSNVAYDAVSRDGFEVDFWLTYDDLLTSEVIKKLGAKGVGLFRSEIAFMEEAGFPDEGCQFQLYKRVVESVSPYPVILRTWDVGGDKFVGNALCKDPNPFLGLRAMRYCLREVKIFKKQLRAMLRASIYGRIKILYPMISSADDLLQANEILEICKKELKLEKIPFDERISVGAMVELPSAVFVLDQLSEYCNFFSVGTNDLVQYTLAVDRTNNNVSEWYEVTHPAILRILKNISDASLRQEIPVSICGEMANSAVSFLMCLGLGFRSFTVHTNQLKMLKNVLHVVDIRELRECVCECVCYKDSKKVLQLFEKKYCEILNRIKK